MTKKRDTIDLVERARDLLVEWEEHVAALERLRAKATELVARSRQWTKSRGGGYKSRTGADPSGEWEGLLRRAERILAESKALVRARALLAREHREGVQNADIKAAELARLTYLNKGRRRH